MEERTRKTDIDRQLRFNAQKEKKKKKESEDTVKPKKKESYRVRGCQPVHHFIYHPSR